MKKLINVMLLITMLLCQYSCVDCKDAFEPEAPSVEPENKVEAEVKVIVSTGAATNITNATATISGIVKDLETNENVVDIGFVYSRTDSNPSVQTGIFVFISHDPNADCVVTLSNLSSGSTYYYRTYVYVDGKGYYGEVKTFTTIDEITSGQEVDLGLSVKWAGWNVGANSPEEYGGYYAWGETEEKSEYSWDTYKYWQDTDADGSVDESEMIDIGDTICGTQYDVATVKWGNGWRMPTKAEMEELASKCTFVDYSYKGVSGCKVIGPNGNAIFLPYAGCRYGTSLINAGSSGYYWSGSLNGDFSTYAWYLYVYSNGYHDVYGSNRGDGQSVRPVRDY